MALEKNYDYLGKVANYWKITKIIQDNVTNRTMVELRLYWDKDARVDEVKNYLPYREVKEFNKVDLTTDAAYTNVKASVKDKDGEETNYFVDAKDVLEVGQVIVGDLGK